MNTFPPFYNPDKVGTLAPPDAAVAIAAGLAAGLPPARSDTRRVILLLVDPQVDFIHPDGALSVPGAVDDTRRTVAWIYRHVAQITTISASLDSHLPTQIFFATWWRNPAGQHPAPFTAISAADVEAGRWLPVYEPEWSRDYVRTLGASAKKLLMIWPYHTLIGTPGHAITPTLYEAIAYHSAARGAQPRFVPKGSLPKTEHYSLLEPEVKVPDHPEGGLNTTFLATLATYDLVYVAGQAKSHCVLETLASVMRAYQDRPDEIAKWRVLTDCMSSVAHPEIDFDVLAESALAEYAAKGLRLVKSTDPIG